MNKTELKELIREVVADVLDEGKLSYAEIGDYLHQKISRGYESYSVIIGKLKNGGFRVVTFLVIDGKMTGKAKIASSKNWNPEPTIIKKKDVPPKVLQKLEDKMPS